MNMIYIKNSFKYSLGFGGAGKGLKCEDSSFVVEHEEAGEERCSDRKTTLLTKPSLQNEDTVDASASLYSLRT